MSKARVLIVGTGGVGTMAAYALETGGRAEVTAVMRSNYAAAKQHGIDIDSVEHGRDIKGWRPTTITQTVPDVSKEGATPFDFILVTTKNVPEISPTVSDIIAPAVTPDKTAIVLSQNGLNIEKAVISRFPTNPVISSISYIGATLKPNGAVLHDDADEQKIGPFAGSQAPASVVEEAARRYVSIYNPAGKLGVVYDGDVRKVRWRKLVYNASYNSVAAVLHMDTPRMRMSRHVIDDLIRPIMREILAAAAACGVADLPDDLPETVIRADPTDTAFKPSMAQDADKKNLMEVENIVGEPLREGEAKGVPMPTLRVVYGMLKGLQLQAREAKGLWEPKFEPDNPYQ
ncbi:putative 2-dehydropantoate 2-reductase [Xylariomycetidae sp. FL2044]|nr:putative 2-dehydropantoate 2-reductase [Xylariomycetidae sp. FL2044]